MLKKLITSILTVLMIVTLIQTNFLPVKAEEVKQDETEEIAEEENKQEINVEPLMVNETKNDSIELTNDYLDNVNYNLPEGSYYLSSDLVANRCINVNGTVQIDLNSHKLSSNDTTATYDSVFAIGNSGNLIITDNSDNKTGSIDLSDSTYDYDQVINVNGGTLVFNSGKITNSKLDNAVIANNGGTVSINSGSITSCSSTNGTILNKQSGVINFSGGLIDDCEAIIGAGIHNISGTVNMSGGKISNCEAHDPKGKKGAGGAIVSEYGTTLNLSGGTITNCKADNGIVRCDDCTLNITGGTVNNCETKRFGIIVAIGFNTKINIYISGLTLIDNTVGTYGTGFVVWNGNAKFGGKNIIKNNYITEYLDYEDVLVTKNSSYSIDPNNPLQSGSEIGLILVTEIQSSSKYMPYTVISSGITQTEAGYFFASEDYLHQTEYSNGKLIVNYKDFDVSVNQSIIGGTVTPSKTKAHKGERVYLFNTPATAYKFNKYIVKDSRGKNITVTSNYFTMPEDDVTVSAKFDEVVSQIKLSSTTHGKMYSSASYAKEGDTVIITFAPSSGYELSYAYMNNEPLEVVNNKATFVMPNKKATITAKFNSLIRKISVKSVSGGSVKASTSRSLTNARITLKISPKTGYYLHNIEVIGLKTGKTYAVDNNNSFVVPNEDVMIYPTFKKSLYNINTLSTTHGTIDVSTASAGYKDYVYVYATPDKGYKLKSWVVTNTVSGRTMSVSRNRFVMTAGDVNVSAIFVENLHKINTLAFNGKLMLDKKYAKEGDEVTIIAQDGKIINSISINKGTVEINEVIPGKKYSFIMPNKIATITAKLSKDY